jgi:hypothetical protein
LKRLQIFQTASTRIKNTQDFNMHTIAIPKEKNVHLVPSCLEELNTTQFLSFCDLLLKYQQGKITIEQFKVAFVIKLADIRFTLPYWLLNKEKKEAVNSEIYRLSSLADSFFTDEIREDKPVSVLQLNFIKQFIPVIGGKYYGPSEGLQDCSFCEYRMAYTHFKSYMNSEQEEDLDKMIAVLYRPRKAFLWLRKRLPGYDGHRRQSFTSKSNPVLFEKRVERISLLPMPVKYGIFLFFSGCNNNLATGEIEIEGNKIDLSLLYKKSSSGKSDPGIGLVGLLYSLAETKVFGSIEETDSQNIYDIMARLFQVMKQFEAAKAK